MGGLPHSGIVERGPQRKRSQGERHHRSRASGAQRPLLARERRALALGGFSVLGGERLSWVRPWLWLGLFRCDQGFFAYARKNHAFQIQAARVAA
jgi:hypothetical protein